MNTILWLVAGGLLGWALYVGLNVNASRGLLIAAIIGVAGGFFGGSVLTPLFASAAAADFSPFALALACISATACLVVSDKVYERYGF